MVPYVCARQPDVARRAARGRRCARLHRALRARRRSPFRAHAVQPSALHPVLERHHGRAQVHRARRGRRAAHAPEGAPAALRREAGRPRVLLHDLRLDDVELAGVARSPPGPRCCSTTARPSWARGNVLFDFAAAEDMTHFGTSAKFIDAVAKVRRRARCARTTLPALRAMLSTGSPLAPEGFDYVYAQGEEGRVPVLHQRRHGPGRLLRRRRADPAGVARRAAVPRCSRMAVEVFDDEGRSLPAGREGRARVHGAVPDDAARLLERSRTTRSTAPPTTRSSPNVWRHGDWCEITDARRPGDLRALRRGAEPGRRAHRHGGDLPAGREARRGGRVDRDRPGLAEGRARGALRAPARRASCSTRRSSSASRK